MSLRTTDSSERTAHGATKCEAGPAGYRTETGAVGYLRSRPPSRRHLQLPATVSTCGAFMNVTPAVASVDTGRRTHVGTSLRKLRRTVR